MKRQLYAFFWAGVALFAFGATRTWACYAVIVGRAASADGSVLVGHNEENGGRRLLNFRAVPARRFPKGAKTRLLRGGTISAVEQTAGFLWSENVGLEFSDAYLNQWGVAVVSDGCPSREEALEVLIARGEIRDGGIGYMLRRLIAERARSAREGVQLAGRLIERFGYVSPGRTYVVADPREAWLLAVVRGRRWVAQRVPDDVVVLLPNVYVIQQIDLNDRNNFLASPDLISYAVARGWYDPSRKEPFNFRRVYGRPPYQPDPRRMRGRQLVTGRVDEPEDGEPPPIGVRPMRPMTIADVTRVLRDRALLRDAFGRTRTISTPYAQESAVFQLREGIPREIGCVYWRATAEPAISVYTPWYLGITGTPPAYFRPGPIDRQLTLEQHFHPPSGTFDEDPQLAWWTFKRLQDWVHEDLPRRLPVVRRSWNTLEHRMLSSQRAVERRALEFARKDMSMARTYLTRYCEVLAEEACQTARSLLLSGPSGQTARSP
ncbi:MAG: hypothetical protein GXP27_09740 [Planctomycetes bacterium]|nr:hypothetical protein [Planctomycetota bacterium]